MAKWVQSHRDLPMLLNQWANVVRWELRPRPFLRTTEFLWQEGHTAHATREDAAAYALRIHLMSCEAMMGDGKALQMATSHELGQNFAKAFDITYTDTNGKVQTCWTTSWGSSTRMIGGLIMAHGDDNGLVLPPNVAPSQAIVMVVKGDDRANDAARDLMARLAKAGVRVRADNHTDQGFGRRVTDWELKGVPVRIEIGPRDLDAGQVTIARRDTGTKTAVALEDVAKTIPKLLTHIQTDMLAAARARLAERTVEATSVEEALEAAQTGFARIPWGTLGENGERSLYENAVSVRCLQTPDGTVPDATTPQDELVAIVSRSY
jgi:prolyl-tRNA synthetase